MAQAITFLNHWEKHFINFIQILSILLLTSWLVTITYTTHFHHHCRHSFSNHCYQAFNSHLEMDRKFVNYMTITTNLDKIPISLHHSTKIEVHSSTLKKGTWTDFFFSKTQAVTSFTCVNFLQKIFGSFNMNYRKLCSKLLTFEEHVSLHRNFVCGFVDPSPSEWVSGWAKMQALTDVTQSGIQLSTHRTSNCSLQFSFNMV